ncbi:MAG: hypothetical protein IJ093_02300 [Bacilli bacterium]|nr:hypothetical protein [Bacilli bacterium]
MLEQDRFLVIKNLAKEIRKENEKIFKSFEKDSIADAIKEKNEFVESTIEAMEGKFSEGDRGKEEKQIFRANILIPDDVEFFQNYSKDKNIRNLMNKYSVGIEDIMSKITELNIYGKYIDVFGKNEEEPKEEDYDFVDEMINLSSKEAESLLDEIEDLSNEVDKMNLPSDEKEKQEEAIKPEDVVLPKFEEPKVEEEKPLSKPKTNDDEFESISGAVLGFIDESNKLRGELSKANEEKASLKVDLDKLKEESIILKDNLERVSKENKELQNSLKEINEQNSTLKDDLDQVNKEKNIILEQFDNSKNDNASLKENLKELTDKIDSTKEELDKVNQEKASLKVDLDKITDDRNTLKDQIVQYVNEISELRKSNLESAEALKNSADENKKLSNEITSLKEKLEVLEQKAAKSSELIQKIYNCIPK